MKASIKANFTKADIEKMMNDIQLTVDNAIMRRLVFVGERFVANARMNGNYVDHTGNLRSSIKYFILKDGKIVYGEFNDAVKPVITKNNELAEHQPVNEEKSVLAQIQEEHPKGFVLVGIAGMNYAAYVESKNYDVITSSAIAAENDLRKALEEMKKNLFSNKK